MVELYHVNMSGFDKFCYLQSKFLGAHKVVINSKTILRGCLKKICQMKLQNSLHLFELTRMVTIIFADIAKGLFDRTGV